jgi:hypothetical protein
MSSARHRANLNSAEIYDMFRNDLLIIVEAVMA